MITPIQHKAMLDEVGDITDRDHLELKLRFVVQRAAAVIKASPLAHIVDGFSAAQAAELAEDLTILGDVLWKGAQRLRGMRHV